MRLFGIYLPGPKQNAILRGDVSNTVVSSFFVHALAGLGMYFCADVGPSLRWVQIRAKHAQRTFEQIAEINGGSDANLTVQVSFSLAIITLRSRWLDSARKCLTTTCVALNAAGLRFIPATDRPPELTEDVRERLVVLSQVIYMENYMFLVVDGTEPKMTVRIEKEFRHDLHVSVRSLTPAAWTDDKAAANIPSLVRDVPVDHAHPGNFVGQGCDFDHEFLFR